MDVKLDGPVHKYVELPTVLAVRLRSKPKQTVLLLAAVGAVGVCLMVTVVVPAAVGGQPATVAITE